MESLERLVFDNLSKYINEQITPSTLCRIKAETKSVILTYVNINGFKLPESWEVIVETAYDDSTKLIVNANKDGTRMSIHAFEESIINYSF